MVFIVMCFIIGCAQDIEKQPNVVNLQSPCLDGIFKNMMDRGCLIDIRSDESGRTRYTCLMERIEPWDVWTTRTFSTWKGGDAPSQEYLDKNSYKTVCTDWSLEIFYR